MRHLLAGRQFGRNSSHRRAMLRALTANLVAHERIQTTGAKAKELRRVAERVITRAIRLGPIAYTPLANLAERDRARRLAAQQQVGRFLHRFGTVRADGREKTIDLVEKVFVDLAQRFRDRPGGYTRIIKLLPSRGDNAPMAIVELVEGAKVAAVEPGEKRAAKAEKKVKEKAEAKKAEQAKAAEEAKAAEAKAAEAKAAGEVEPADAKASEPEAEEPKVKKKTAKPKAAEGAAEKKPKKPAQKKT